MSKSFFNSIGRVTLDLRSIGVTLFNSQYECGESWDREGRRLVRTLRAQIVAEQQKPYQYETPRTWWDSFKQTYFPGWLLRWFPAQMTTNWVSVETVYPFLKTKIPPDLQGQSVTVLFSGIPAGSFLTDFVDCMTPDKWDREVEAICFAEQRCDSRTCPTCKRTLRYE